MPNGFTAPAAADNKKFLHGESSVPRLFMSGHRRTRLAPTPSGYLHEGNAVAFVITAALARRLKAAVLLRIDDLDAERYRPEYAEDIFRQLEWLGLTWDEGPQGSADLKKWSQRNRSSDYEALLRELEASGRIYGCRCSRRELRQSGNVCPCRGKNLNRDETPVLRFHTGGLIVPGRAELHSAGVTPVSAIPDFVIRRREGYAAYQLASLCDDLRFGVNLVVRGRDLLDSTAMQLVLAEAAGEKGRPFLEVEFFHHPLLLNPDGSKLSKSQSASPLREIRNGRSPEWIYRKAGELLGLSEVTPDVDSLAQLLRLRK